MECSINSMSSLSKKTGSEIALEIDSVQIGWIENGIPDSGIKIGLMAEWKNKLGI